MQFKVPFDDHLKEQLGDYSPAVPDHIWENVRQKKDKKRPLFFFWRSPNFILILLSIVATGSLIGYFLFHSSYQTSAFTITTTSTQQTNISLNSIRSQKLIIDQHASKINENTNTKEELNFLPDKENISVEKILTNHSFSNSQVTNTLEKNSPKIKQVTEQNKFSKKQQQTIKERTSVSISQPSLDENDNINETYTGIQFSNESLLLSSPQVVDLISLKHSALPKLRSSLKINLNIPCPENNKNPAANKKYIELYAATDYVLRQFSDTPNSNYMRMRKESTSFASAYSAGIRFTKVFNNGFNIRAGLNYSQINEKFKFVQGNIIQVVFIINASGDTIGSYQTSSTRYKTSFNHYKTLDIPLMIGYETSKGKWNVNFNTGLMVNIHSWNQGEVLNDSLQPVNISGLSHNPYQFKTNIGIGGIGAISCYYSLNEKLSILAEPYLRYNFSSMNKAEITLKQKYHTSGIKFGIRLNL